LYYNWLGALANRSHKTTSHPRLTLSARARCVSNIRLNSLLISPRRAWLAWARIVEFCTILRTQTLQQGLNHNPLHAKQLRTLHQTGEHNFDPKWSPKSKLNHKSHLQYPKLMIFHTNDKKFDQMSSEQSNPTHISLNTKFKVHKTINMQNNTI